MSRTLKLAVAALALGVAARYFITPSLSAEEKKIARLQAQGRADRELDPHYAARALTGMVWRFAYMWFSQGIEYDFEKAVTNLPRLWANALRLDQP